MEEHNCDDSLFALEDKSKFCKTLSIFYSSSETDAAREDAGESLIISSASEESAALLIQCNLLSVCEALILMNCSPSGYSSNRISVITLCIIGNLLTLGSGRKFVLENGSIFECLGTLLLTSYDPRSLSECLRIFIIAISSDGIPLGILPLNALSGIGSALKLIQTNSKDPELVARSWELCYHISLNHSCKGIEEILSSWELNSSLLIDDVVIQISRNGSTGDKTGLCWLMMFLDVVFSESCFAGIFILRRIEKEVMEVIYRAILHVIRRPGTSSLSREESFCVASCLDSMVSFDAKLLPGSEVPAFIPPVFSFIMETTFEALLSRDEQVMTALTRLMYSWVWIYKQYIDELDLSDNLKSLIGNVFEIVLDPDVQIWLLGVLKEFYSTDTQHPDRDLFLNLINKLESFISLKCSWNTILAMSTTANKLDEFLLKFHIE